MAQTLTLYVFAVVVLFCYLDTGQANYRLEVKIHSYSYLSHCNNNGSCCDNCAGYNCCAQCNITFVYCPFYSTSLPSGSPSCPLGCQLLAGNDSIQGLNQTLVFNGTLWPGYLNLSIQVYQYSLRCNVDQFFLQKIPLIVASNFTKAASHFGVYQNGSISLSFRVSCAQKFSGPSFYANCSDSVHTCCKNSCLNGGTCNRIRSNRCVCVCPTGYTGQSCETSTMNACNQFSPCQNGSRFTILPKGYNCSCANGFTCTDRIIRTPAASVMTAITTSSTSASFRIVTSMNMITTAVATQTVTTSANASVAFASAVNSIYISATDAINNNFNCTDAAACVGTSKSAGIKATASPGDVVEAVDAAKGQAGAPEIAGVVVTLIVVVTLGIVGAVTVAVCIVHKRSKMNTDEGLGTCVDTTNNNPTYDQNAVSVVTLPLTAPPLEIDFDNPVYSSSGIADAKGSSVLVSNYEQPAMEYEMVKEREQSSMYATLEPETVYHEA